MLWKTAACLISLVLAIHVEAQALDRKHPDSVAVSFPGKAWAVEVDSPGFTSQAPEKRPDGREYLLANNSKTNVELSITLEESTETADNNTCPSYLQQRVQSMSKLGLADIRTSEVNSMAVVEFLIPVVQAIPIQQKNLIACSTNEDIYIDVHLSKAQFQPADEALLMDILKHVRITGQSAPVALGGSTVIGQSEASMDYFREGSRFYAKQDFKGAIGPYQKALDMEDKQPSLGKNLWRVLVDNLGMAYGITGDLDHAEMTFNYGISKDSSYPMFYYNLACTYAERNNMTKSIDYLRKAFAVKANAIPGEGMPDPRHDDSFQRFMPNDQFRQFADSLFATQN